MSQPISTTAPNHNNLFTVVLPCFNEEENIVSLVAEIFASMENAQALVANYEVIVVDDCGTDQTATRLRDEYPSGETALRIIRHLNNCGQSAAVCSGVEAAQFPWIITLDGDGQNDPADIPRLISSLRELDTGDGCPMICGYRKNRKDSWIRKISSRVANGVRSRILGDATPDTGCGLKLFNREAFLRFPRFNHMHRFLPALARRDNGLVRSVEVNHRPRVHGVSKYGVHNRLWVGLVDLFGVMWLSKRQFRRHETEEL